MFLKKISYIFLVLILLTSCSEYEKILKSTDVDLKYKKALSYYQKDDFGRAMTIFEQISLVTRGTGKNDTVMFYLANCYYKQNDYIMAGNQYKNFTRIYANSPFAEEAEFMVGYCHYMMSPRPSLDQNETVLAIEAFRLFISKFPNSPKTDESQALIKDLNEKLVEKSYLSAKLYFELEDYKASIIALNNSLGQYPDTKFREEMMFLVLKSNYLLAYNSVPGKKRERYQSALDEYYSFISEFPESEFKKEVERMYKNSQKELHIDQTVVSN
jgi:outer membrane protein assembly factor BamD